MGSCGEAIWEGGLGGRGRLLVYWAADLGPRLTLPCAGGRDPLSANVSQSFAVSRHLKDPKQQQCCGKGGLCLFLWCWDGTWALSCTRAASNLQFTEQKPETAGGFMIGRGTWHWGRLELVSRFLHFCPYGSCFLNPQIQSWSGKRTHYSLWKLSQTADTVAIWPWWERQA